MTSVCPVCRLRTKVPRAIVGDDPQRSARSICRVCGTEWWPYDPTKKPVKGKTAREEAQ